MAEQPARRLPVKAPAAGLIRERAADAIDQGRFARAVRPDEPDALAFEHGKIDAVERDETAEPLAQARHFEERHYFARRRSRSCSKPTIPFGAMMTKATSKRPTISRLTAEEI